MPRRSKSVSPIHTFRVRLLGGPYPPPNEEEVWRDIEVAGNQTLGDLGDMISSAFDFYEEHLWSFFLSGKPWDTETEYSLNDHPNLRTGQRPRLAHRTRIGDVPLFGKKISKEWLYIFDFGDEWHFGVQFMGASDKMEPGAAYPRVAASQGTPPPQYPDMDEDWDEEEEDEGDES